jgi:hypothetical protein
MYDLPLEEDCVPQFNSSEADLVQSPLSSRREQYPFLFFGQEVPRTLTVETGVAPGSHMFSESLLADSSSLLSLLECANS